MRTDSLADGNSQEFEKILIKILIICVESLDQFCVIISSFIPNIEKKIGFQEQTQISHYTFERISLDVICHSAFTVFPSILYSILFLTHNYIFMKKV